MAAPRETIWSLEPHTRAKHAILKRYLQAWLPILAQSGFSEVLFVDGFAGPGQYIGGDDGSPVIALKSSVEQQDSIRSTVYFRFIEMEQDRADFLLNLVDSISVPRRYNVKVLGGHPFSEVFADLLTKLEDRKEAFPATFAFIDPFGWKGVPFRLIQQLMTHRACEVLITFMYEEINRFIGLGNQVMNFDEFFGSNEWHKGIDIAKPRERSRFFHDLYVRQLRDAAGISFVRSFEMRNDSDVTDYFLFYGTNNKTGLKKMKEAMWKVDQSGEFRFSDATDPNQTTLFTIDPHDFVRDLLLKKYADCETTVGDVEDFLLYDTPYRETHYKSILRELELAQESRLEVVNPPSDRRRGSFAKRHLKLRFR